MKLLLRLGIAWIAASVAVTPFAAAQAENLQSIHGVVEQAAGLAGLTVHLKELGGDRTLAQSSVRFDGTFSILNVEMDQRVYELVVGASGGQVLTREILSMSHNSQQIRITLPPQAQSGPPHATVSTARLAHRTPRKAMKAYRKSDRIHAGGDLLGSIRLLETAVSLDPQFFEAQNNLGVRYLRARQYERAVPHLEAAATIDESQPIVLVNLSFAYQALGRYREAEDAARNALALAPSSDAARYALGIALASSGGNLTEAVQHLRSVSDRFPKARLVLDLLARAEPSRRQRAQHGNAGSAP